MNFLKSDNFGKKNIYFADLFAGNGVFHHIFMNSLKKYEEANINASCKLVCEIDKYAKELFRRNRKLEWQAGLETKFEDTYLQERQSGLHFKRTDYFPTLVATVQTPLVNQNGYWRRLSPKEVSRLQSFPSDHYICGNEFQAYKQYGNSINVKVAEYVIDQYLMQYIRKLANE